MWETLLMASATKALGRTVRSTQPFTTEAVRITGSFYHLLLHVHNNIPGQRSLAGCSPWGSKKSDMTEVTEQARRHIVPCIGGGVKGSYMGTP